MWEMTDEKELTSGSRLFWDDLGLIVMVLGLGCVQRVHLSYKMMSLACKKNAYTFFIYYCS